MTLQRVLYIGQYQPGTTSFARGCALRELLPGAEFTYVDTLEPFHATPRMFRSIGFRWKAGPLVTRVNDFVLERVGAGPFDLVWVDKAVFLTKATTAALRQVARRLVHFTPDPAFSFHRSRHFEQSLHHYDTLVTTKSYELDDYAARVGRDRVLLVTQGYDSNQHYSRKGFRERVPGVCFIGHHEKHRQEIIEAIVHEQIPVYVAGRGWGRFARRYGGNRNVVYGGTGRYGEAYAQSLSEYQFGLGLLSKWVPEKHTTRTFEIPACGAILLTERNHETAAFFSEQEAIFFDDTHDLLKSLVQVLGNADGAERMAQEGSRRVREGGYDYESIVAKVLKGIDAQRDDAPPFIG